MENKYLDDIKEIKDIMNRSSRFISLSGLSGIATGISALLGAFLAYQFVLIKGNIFRHGQIFLDNGTLFYLILIAFATFTLAAISAILFTTRKTRKEKEKIWDHQTKRLLINLFIPLFTGGIVCLILLQNGYIGLVPGLTLIFYGLALINSSKYTLGLIRSLGVFEIVLGILALHFISHSLLLWCLGFGLLHIVYGFIIQWKHKS